MASSPVHASKQSSQRFAGLIPADWNEPDIFETSSVDSSVEYNSEQADSTDGGPIEEPHVYGDSDIDERIVTPAEAFEVFAGRVFHARKADFSDSLAGVGESSDSSRKKGTRRFRVGEKEVVALETRAERVERLKREIDEVLAEGEDDEVGGRVLEELRTLRSALEARGSRMGSRSLNGIRALRANGNTGKERDDEKKEKKNDGISAETEITLDLYPKDESMILDFERRISKLERVLGPAQNESSDEISSTGLFEIASSIQRRLNIMDEGHLKVYQKGIKDLKEALDSLKNSRQQVFEDASKIARAYYLMEKWDGLVGLLPTIVARLRSMKRLHDEAAGFSDALRAVDASQRLLETETKNHDVIVKDLKRTLEINLETIGKNMRALDQRISEIS